MKKAKLILVNLLAVFSISSSQVITFDSLYTQYKDYYFIGAEQKKDSSYCIAAACYNIFKLIYISKKGIVTGYDDLISEWLPIRKNPLCNTNDNGWAVVSSVLKANKTSTYVYVSLTKFNSDNKIEWQKSYGDSLLSEHGLMVMQTDNSDYFILAGMYNNPILIRTDSLGNLIWKKHYKYPQVFTHIDCHFIRLQNQNLIIANSSTLLSVNQNGDSLWTSTLTSIINSISPLRDGGFLACTNTILFKLDNSGNIIWQKEFPNKLTDMVEVHDKRIALVAYGQSSRYLRILDENGNEEEKISLSTNNALFVKETLDNGLMISGTGNMYSVYTPPWLMKTDSSYEMKKLNLVDGYYLFTIGEQTKITWSSKAVYKVDLYYSTDEGVNWIEIVKSLPDTGSYNWIVPETPTFNGRLKIVDSEYPDLSDISDFDFYILYPGTTNYIAINQIYMFIGNNGMGSHHPLTDGCGLFWPGGNSATIPAVFSDGLVWGGKLNGEIRVNGDTHRYGLQPGIILPSGLPDDPLKKEYKIWKIRKDWDVLPPGDERNQYQYDYENWPGQFGAPYEDINFDGQFTKGVDRPKFYGDETLWFVANDLDSATTHYTYGSDPIGLEVQVTTYGYNRIDELGDVVFKKYKLINKSNQPLTETYFGYFSDTDLGDANDDYVGCDTLINLGYCYNSDNIDQGYYETPPPAIGYLLLQGPSVNSISTDSAFFNDRWLKGKKNLWMSSSVPNLKNTDWTYEPYQGNYSGSLEYYNFLDGLRNLGQPMIDPNTGATTKFGLAGDPVSGIGWYEGAGWPNGPYPGDRRLFISSGPFGFAAGDTQEVVYAIIVAKGSDNINSVQVLKEKAKSIRNFYYYGILSNVTEDKNILNEFELFQNYPNPFNPSTTIKYSLPEKSFVQLKLFDILGKEIATLVNEEQTSGIHHYTLSIINSKLSSGVYFYQLKAGSFISTKKLLMEK